jgi:hypothetical protein
MSFKDSVQFGGSIFWLFTFPAKGIPDKHAILGRSLLSEKDSFYRCILPFWNLRQNSLFLYQWKKKTLWNTFMTPSATMKRSLGQTNFFYSYFRHFYFLLFFLTQEGTPPTLFYNTQSCFLSRTGDCGESQIRTWNCRQAVWYPPVVFNHWSTTSPNFLKNYTVFNKWQG